MVRGWRRWALWGVGFAALAAVAFWWFTLDPYPREIRIAAGSSGGLYYRVAEGLAEELRERTGKPVRVLATQGALENRRLLDEGRAELAMLQAGAVSARGTAAIAPLFTEHLVVVVRREAGATRVADLAGQRVAIGREGSGMRVMALFALEGEGMTVDSIEAVSAPYFDLYADASLQGAFITSGLSNPELRRLLETGRFDVVPLSQPDLLAMDHRFLAPSTVPQGLVQRPRPIPDQDVPTVATQAVLVTTPTATNAFVRTTLAALYESEMLEDFAYLATPAQAAEFAAVPRHPAARQYFDPLGEVGLVSSLLEGAQAGQELIVAAAAGVYLLWNQRRNRKHKAKEAALAKQKEALDYYLNETIRIERAQLGVYNPALLRCYADDVTRLKLDALESLTEEKLREDSLFQVFLIQSASLNEKIHMKMAAPAPPAAKKAPSSPQRDPEF